MKVSDHLKRKLVKKKNTSNGNNSFYIKTKKNKKSPFYVKTKKSKYGL